MQNIINKTNFITRKDLVVIAIIVAIIMVFSSFQLIVHPVAAAEYLYDESQDASRDEETGDENPGNDSQDDGQNTEPDVNVPEDSNMPDQPNVDDNSHNDTSNQAQNIDAGSSASERGPHVTLEIADFDELKQTIENMSTGNGYTVYLSCMTMRSEIVVPAGVEVTLTNKYDQTNLIQETEGQRHFVVYGILRLHSNIILEGANDPAFNHGGVEVADGGHLLMSSDGYYGSTITGNTADVGGGVNVNTGGRLTLYGDSAIIANTATVGGGVYVDSYAELVMFGGDIVDNFSIELGGGIAVLYGTLTMYDGNVFGNSSAVGGGVAVRGGTFNMNNGSVSGNSASELGGGVAIKAQSYFLIHNGYVAYNFAHDEQIRAIGGGVYVEDSIFVMYDGNITSNISYIGGNVAVLDGVFYMYDGLLYNGTAIYGGGVFSDGYSRFTMNDGEISSNYAIISGGGILISEYNDSSGVELVLAGGEIVNNSEDTGQSSEIVIGIIEYDPIIEYISMSIEQKIADIDNYILSNLIVENLMSDTLTYNGNVIIYDNPGVVFEIRYNTIGVVQPHIGITSIAVLMIVIIFISKVAVRIKQINNDSFKQWVVDNGIDVVQENATSKLKLIALVISLVLFVLMA